MKIVGSISLAVGLFISQTSFADFASDRAADPITCLQSTMLWPVRCSDGFIGSTEVPSYPDRSNCPRPVLGWRTVGSNEGWMLIGCNGKSAWHKAKFR
jgi:hypothetical protein